MSISPRNLWPEDIAVTQIVAPVAILKEQAALLGERTKNLVEGRVTQRKRDFMDFSKLTYDFDLVAPALDHYQYRLFSISHNVEFYPLTIDNSDALNDSQLHVNDEEEFLHALGQIFSSEKTKGVIKSLVAQSRA
ncbi:MAG: hypothetical protein AABO41_10805 [Acidobacteriota bacterium]